MPLSLHRRKQKSPRAEMMTSCESSSSAALTSPAETDATHLLPDPTNTNRFTGRADNCHTTEGSTSPPQEEEDYSSSHHHETDDHTTRKIKNFPPNDRNNWWKMGGIKTMRWIVLAVVLHNLVIVRGAGEVTSSSQQGGNNWERPGVMPKIAHLEVMCGNSHMEVHLAFDKPFHGLVTSKGMYGQGDCIYVPPRTGKSQFVFNIYYDKCGTKPDNHGKFYENTIVVQYDEELIEAWDEAKRLRCEWFNDYEKTATKTSPMVISDLDIVELNFHGDNVDCWMEIQEGKGPWAAPLNGIAPLGSPLTMVIAVKDPSGEFDMRVKDCEASDGSGAGRTLPLSDPEGCIMRPKLLGKFSKVKLDDGRATVLTYAFISAFKFPDMLNVHLRCTVEICRHGCPDHCTSANANQIAGSASEPVAAGSIDTVSKVVAPPPPPPPKPDSSDSNESSGERKPEVQHQHHRFPTQQQILHSGEMFGANVPPQMRPPPPPPLPQFGGRPQRAPRPEIMRNPFQSKFPMGLMRPRGPDNLHHHRFPPGPPPPNPRFTGTIKHTIPIPPPMQGELRNHNVDEQQTRHEQNTLLENMLLKPEPKKDNDDEPEVRLSERSGEPSNSKEQAGQTAEEKVGEKVAESQDGGEREMLMEAQPLKDDQTPPPPPPTPSTNFPKGPRHLRLRRSVSTPRDVIGVSGAFKVVSQADLNFALNPTSSSQNSTDFRPPNTIILRGTRMSSPSGRSTPPIYGICLPRIGFGVVFFGLGLATLVAILIAAFLAYAHYAVVHYKSSHGGQCPGMASLPPGAGVGEQPQYIHQFPMLILKKMW